CRSACRYHPVASFFVGGHFLAAHCGLFGRWRLAAAVGRVIISGRTRARPVLTGLCSDIRYRLGCRITLEEPGSRVSNFSYASGASARGSSWVTTELGLGRPVILCEWRLWADCL